MTMLLLIAALQVCWIAPTENVDGTSLTDLTGFNIYYGATSRNYSDTVPVNDPAATCHTFAPVPGTYFVAMTALDADSNESAFSNEIIKTEAADTIPRAPILLAQDEIVYTVIKQPDRFVLLPIGTVPAGTSCDPNNSANGHGAVPNDAVVWTSSTGPRPIVVVARCDG